MTPVQTTFDRLHQASRRDPNPSLEVRRDRLTRLEAMVVAHRDDIVQAIADDFSGRSRTESLSADVLLVLDGVREAKRHLARWLEPRAARPHPFFLPARASVSFQPKGVVGIIAPWNYPVNLALAPMVGALAAGNRVLLKPSELTPATARLLSRMVAETFAGDEVAVVEGGVEVAREVSALPFDHLLFTGSTSVGRQVARAAAENLVPCTLELGGKSPALVHPDYPIEQAAERIAVGKLFNAGQTCIAPDYALVPRTKVRAFAEAFLAATARLYPSHDGLTAIISERAKQRLEALVADAKDKGATVTVAPGNGSGRVMAPVVLREVRDDMLAMQDEIFGPVLPVEGYDSMDEALARIAKRPRPLAAYLFDADLDRARATLDRVVCGGACINDTLVHFAQEQLPFGGVGPSGMGAYHGETGFLTFSHQRSTLVASRVSAAKTFMTPPYGPLVDRALELLVRGLRPGR